MLFKLHFINIIVVVISIILCTVVPPFEQAHWYTTIFHLFCVILQNHVLLSVLPFHYISCFGPTSYTLIHMNALFMWSLTNKDTYIKHIKIFPHWLIHRQEVVQMLIHLHFPMHLFVEPDHITYRRDLSTHWVHTYKYPHASQEG